MINSLSPETMGSYSAKDEAAEGKSSPHMGQPGPEGLTLATFMRFMREAQDQPSWRKRADREMDFLAGNQLDSELLRRQAAIGIPPAIENLIAPAIESVLGFEAKTRTDWRITGEGDGKQVGEALNFKVNQAERKAGADKACSMAFLPQLSVGLGWVEVSRESDPFKYPYRCLAVHRNEIHWDMLDREPGLKKARWLTRRRWTDGAQVKLLFPECAALVDCAVGRWGDSTLMASSDEGGQPTGLAKSFEDERGWTISEQDWRQADTGRVLLIECWYRRWERVTVLKTPDGRVVEYDKSNHLHVIAVASGTIKPIQAIVSRMYVSFWMGPHKLYDGKTPYLHQDFPYVQFIGDVEDVTGVPFGRVRHMMYLQENVNSTLAKIRWGLSATRTTRTKGAVEYSDEQFRQMASRVDADIILNLEHMAQPGAVFKIERDFELTEQQYKTLQDSRMGIERASGLTASFQGARGTATSGVQESTQVEQSTQSLASLMDKFKFARTQVGELLISMIVQDMIGKPEEVLIEATPLTPERRIALNVKTVHPQTGVEYLSNDVQRTLLKVDLEDVPSTASFRAQQLAAFSESFKSMPPQYQDVALPHLLALMDVPNRDLLIEEIQRAKNQMTPEAVQKRIDEAVKLALQQSDHALRAREMDLKYNPEKLMAELRKMVADTVKVGVDTTFAAMQAGAQIAMNPGIAPVGDVVMQQAGWQAPNPPGQDPNIPVVAQPMQVAQPEGMPAMPGVTPNTSPQLPGVPASPMAGVETSRTTDNLP